MSMRTVKAFFLAFTVALLPLAGWSGFEEVLPEIEALKQDAISMADDVFAYAELGYLETKSSTRLIEYLGDKGFRITSGVAGIPTAFIAEYGESGPVIGILAEFDALPGLSQAAVPERQSLGGNAGHACGHHLFGSASVTAATAIAAWLRETGTSGRIRVYGTPAEEGGSGKVYMVREGLFSDADAALHWHPSDRNQASPASSTSNKSGRFRFHGIAAHAASAPERGRSALDGVEAMNHMVNLMREHVPEESRIHYVITEGGKAPNIVPEFAEVYYYVRNPEAKLVAELFERVVRAAEGAALGTDTRMKYEVMHGNYPLLRNDVITGLMHENLVRLGGYQLSDEEQVFAARMRETLPPGEERSLDSTSQIEPPELIQGKGSTDVGDVSWTLPTGGFRTATWVPGTAAHSWQAVSAGGMSIGHKGMMLAAKVLALTAAQLYSDPGLIAQARAELEDRRGEDFEYAPLLGDRAPPLDYRAGL